MVPERCPAVERLERVHAEPAGTLLEFVHLHLQRALAWLVPRHQRRARLGAVGPRAAEFADLCSFCTRPDTFIISLQVLLNLDKQPDERTYGRRIELPCAQNHCNVKVLQNKHINNKYVNRNPKPRMRY